MENNEEFTSRVDLRELNETVKAVKAEIHKVIVGQEKMVEHLLEPKTRRKSRQVGWI